MEIVYFELNNWMAGHDYPNDEPFLTWMQFKKENGYYMQLRDETWIKENKLVVVETIVDMSCNYCITATKEWVEKNCPKLLTKYSNFIRHREDNDDVVYGEFGCEFLNYSEENIGYHFINELEEEFDEDLEE